MVKKPVDALLATLKKAGFDQGKFKACLGDQKLLDGVEWVKNRGIDKFKVNPTPTFFINGQVQKGTISFEELDKLIEPLLKL
jgi:protein-disulfide isomerase